jgi:hypothetical protein
MNIFCWLRVELWLLQKGALAEIEGCFTKIETTVTVC